MSFLELCKSNTGLQPMTDSEFCMWRAVFSFVYADNALSLEEQALLKAYLANVPFTTRQRLILKDDLKHPKDVVSLYKAISRDEDKKRFCVLARAIVWCEGDMSDQESKILKKLSCFENPADEKLLHATRNHPHIHDFYQYYARAGMLGLWGRSNPPLVRRYA